VVFAMLMGSNNERATIKFTVTPIFFHYTRISWVRTSESDSKNALHRAYDSLPCSRANVRGL
jgi:hypothetical protein